MTYIVLVQTWTSYYTILMAQAIKQTAHRPSNVSGVCLLISRPYSHVNTASFYGTGVT